MQVRVLSSIHFLMTKEEYYKNPKICPVCGKIIEYKKRGNQTCSQSCGATIGNHKRKLSEETRHKISTSLKLKLKNFNLPKSGIETINILCETAKINENNLNVTISNATLKCFRKCKVCGKLYMYHISYSGRMTFKGKTCSDECYRQLIRNHVNERINNGTFSGWMSRNIKSYAEKFWMQVLKNNNIEYIQEYFLDKKYFLDFYITKNNKYIDLEIDGKQHEYKDRKQHDIERDKYISNKGIIVYRIKWNQINDDEGSILMKNKIDNFLNFYKNI